jgi:hypothetical protein
LIGDRVGTAVVVVANDVVVVGRVVAVEEVVVVSIASAGEQAARINAPTMNLLKVERIGGRVSVSAA